MKLIKKKVLLSLFIIIILFLILIFPHNLTFFSISELDGVDVPYVLDGEELEYNGYKFSNTQGVILSTVSKVNCRWKSPEEDDGYKICSVVFEVDDKQLKKSKINSPEINLDFLESKDVRNIEILYSNEYEVVEQVYEDVSITLEKHSPFENNPYGSLISGNALLKISNEEIKGVALKKGGGRRNSELKEAINELNLEIEAGVILRREFGNFFELIDSEKLVIVENITLGKSNNTLEGAVNINNTKVDGNVLEEFAEVIVGVNESIEANSDVDELVEGVGNYDELINGAGDINASIKGNGNVSINGDGSENGSVEITSGVNASNVIKIKENSNKGIINETLSAEIISEGIEFKIYEIDSIDPNDSFADHLNLINILTGKVTNLVDSEIINSEKPFAVKVSFEIPKYETNSFNFEIIDGEFNAKIDPDVSGCGILDVADSIYFLDQDISSVGTCFEILAENVTLDCQGYSISFGAVETLTYGIYSNSTNTHIRNCPINKSNLSVVSGSGIYLENSNNSIIENNVINLQGNFVSGIKLNYSWGVIVRQNNITTLNIQGYGVYFNGNSDDSKILNNNIYTFGHESYGIYLNQINNLSAESNFISTNYNDAAGIYLFSTNESSISLNTINVSGSSADSLYILDSKNNSIYSNDMYSYGSSGNAIYVRNSHNHSVFSNNLFVYGLYGSGYYSSYFSSYNHFYDNLIYGYGIDRYGIFLEGDNYNNYSNISINTTGDYGYGILLYQSNYNYFDNLTMHLFGEEACGVFLDYPSGRNQFSNLNIWTNNSGASSFYVWYRSHNFTIIDSIFNSTYPDEEEVYFDSLIFSDSPGYFNFTNVSYESDYWNPIATGRLSFYYYLNVYVNDSNNGNLSLVNVSVLDNVSGDLITSSLTDESGVLSELRLRSFLKNGSSSIFYNNNYTINVVSEGVNLSQVINLSENKNLYFNFNSEDIDGLSSSSSSSSSSSGGGGSSSNSSCVSKWVCGKWSDCADGVSTRDCVNEFLLCDLNKPVIEKKCSVNSKNNSKDVLFDINLELLETRVPLNSGIAAKIFLLNIGVPGKVNATLYYEIKDSFGEVVYFGEETVPVETQIEFIKDFDFVNLTEGKYSLSVELTYLGQVEPASAYGEFYIWSIKEIFSLKNIIIFIVVILACVYLIFLIWRRILRVGKKSEELSIVEVEMQGLEKEILNKNFGKIKKCYGAVRESYKKLGPRGKREIYERLKILLKLKSSKGD